jgi:hypothetical protein
MNEHGEAGYGKCTQETSDIFGWEIILPELASFFGVLEHRAQSEHAEVVGTPFNLFLHGRAGTNKTAGILKLVSHLDFSGRRLSIKKIDSSTVHDVAEMAGVVDLHANREEGIAKLIEGDLLKADVLLLDEFLNVQPHVAPQFRLFLQRVLVVLAREVEMQNKCLVATGNLSPDMNVGVANTLDDPTADRFAMLVTVPCFSNLSQGDQVAILERKQSSAFEDALQRQVQNVSNILTDEEFLEAHNPAITMYVLKVVEQLKDSELEPEGRRVQLLRDFVIAAYGCADRDNPSDVHEKVRRVMRACLSTPKLSGIDEDVFQKLNVAHDAAAMFLIGTVSESALYVYSAPNIRERVRRALNCLSDLDVSEKIDLANSVMEQKDPILKLAFIHILGSAVFENEPAQFQEVKRHARETFSNDYSPSLPRGYKEYFDKWPIYKDIHMLVLCLCPNNISQFDTLMRDIDTICGEWKGVR